MAGLQLYCLLGRLQEPSMAGRMVQGEKHQRTVKWQQHCVLDSLFEQDIMGLVCDTSE